MRRRVALLALVILIAALWPPAATAVENPFTEVVGFATKTGHRGVFAWQASQVVNGQVQWGFASDTLDHTVILPGTPDRAQMAVATLYDFNNPHHPDRGKTVFWKVVDLIDGGESLVQSFKAQNAYNDWNGSAYTVDLLVQLDSQSLPSNIPADQALEDIAAGMNIFAERLYDATDGYVRLGEVLVTDTNLDYSANIPFEGVVCETDTSNLADVLVQTTVPFDSHTFGGWSIDHPCISFYVGRLGQLVVPWEDPLHFGYVATHEMAHYALNSPDLYNVANISQAAPISGDDLPWCKNFAWDGSLMHNTGGWNNGKWELTELDRNATLTPCDHEGEPYSWDVLRGDLNRDNQPDESFEGNPLFRYLNVPLNLNGPIDDQFNTKPAGNPDGGALNIHVLNREQANLSSTLSEFIPDDLQLPPCGAKLPQVIDPSGDATGAVVEGEILPNEPSLDVQTGFLTWDPSAQAVTFHITLDDLGPLPPPGATGHLFRFYFDYPGELGAGNAVRYQLQARRDIGMAPTFSLRLADNTVLPGGTLSGAFDEINDEIRIVLPVATFNAAAAAQFNPDPPAMGAGSTLSGFEILGQRVVGAVTPSADIAKGHCSYRLGQELDNIAPRCFVLERNLSNHSIRVGLQDPAPESGLLSPIGIFDATNTDPQVDPFTSGTNAVVSVVAQRINPGQRARFRIVFRDVASNRGACTASGWITF